MTVFDEFALEAGFGDDGDECSADEDTDGDSEKGKRADAFIPASLFLKGDGVGGKEEIEDSVDETHVDGDEDENGFGDEHVKGAEEVFDNNLMEVDSLLVFLGTNGPVFGLVADLLCSALKEDWPVAFWDADQGNEGSESTHDQSDPGRPSPAKGTLSDKATHDRSRDRSDECRRGKRTDSNASIDWTPEISERPTDDGERRAAKKASEEPGDQDRIQILGGGNRNLENPEDDEAEEKRARSAVKLGERAPHQRTESKALFPLDTSARMEICRYSPRQTATSPGW